MSSLDFPKDLKDFYEAQRIIVMDAIRTDFKKNSLTTVSAIGNWVSSALADSPVSRLSLGEADWDRSDRTKDASGSLCWISGLARQEG